MEEMCMSISDFIEKYGKLATALKMLEEVSDYLKHNFDYKDSSPKQSMTREIDELIELCKKEQKLIWITNTNPSERVLESGV